MIRITNNGTYAVRRYSAKAALVWAVTCALLFSAFTALVPSVARADDTNLSQGKNAVASSVEASTVLATNAVDGDTSSDTSRWGSGRGTGPQWIYVDLGAVQSVNSVKVFWESGKATSYKIQVATTSTAPAQDSSDWKDVYTSDNHPTTKNDVISLQSPQNARFVRLYIGGVSNKDPLKLVVDWDTISIYELQVFGTSSTPVTPSEQDPNTNVALNKTGTASSVEDNSANLAADKAFDGNTTSTRWSTARGTGPDWIYVDLGATKDVRTVKLFWESGKADSYRIQTASEGAKLSESSSWKDQEVKESHPQQLEDTLILPDTVKARYVRLYIDKFSETDPLGIAANWNTVSIYEMEVYGGELDPALPTSLSGMANTIKITPIQDKDSKVAWTAAESDKYQVEYKGTDLEQVIGADLTLYRPLVDKTVKMAFKVSEKGTSNYVLKEVPVLVPGQYKAAEADNAAPVILPELQEWKGSTGTFVVGSRVLYSDDSLKSAAEALAADYKALTGKSLSIAKGTSASKGDILLQLTTDTSKGLDNEGYLMDVKDAITVTAEQPTGAYWATRTILQSVKLNGNVPQGQARDYPTYKQRGFILDVGRKTFTLDYLKQIVQQMAWYKMNDFHVHLNDNLIQLGKVPDPMKAYSGFRLESDIKAGGDDGKNQADLTSKDVWYSKDDFRSFIQDSRAVGVNIVPEFDVPAHALALTKVRPDLRYGTSGVQNDHLNLSTKYNESLAFVKNIFNEYMTGDNPVFDKQTTIHFGADEYYYSHDAYRNFVNDMQKFIQDSGRTPRVWGSLKYLDSKNVQVSGKGAQTNLWSAQWADMKESYDLGYGLINSNDGDYYIVPNSGYYHPSGLDANTLYTKAVNTFGGYTVPAGDPQMLGASFAVWNDMTDYHENGVSEYDVYTRIENAFPLMGAKLWGKGSQDLDAANATRAKTGDAPQTNFDYKVPSKGDAIAHYTMDDTSDDSGNTYNLGALTNAQFVSVDGDSALHLKGGASYAEIKGVTTAGLGNDLRVKVKRMSDSPDDQILFESPYGTIKAVQGDTGKVGFTRENRDYSFDYELPVGEWVELEFKNEHNVATLYVNGKQIDVLGDGETVDGQPLLATMMIPFAKIGSQTNAFNGYVDDVRLGVDDTFNTTMDLDEAVSVLASVDPDNKAIDSAQSVIDQYDPTAEDIEKALKDVKAALGAIEYDKADYSRVNQYLSLVPDDEELKQFTPESVRTLKNAIDAIKRDLPAKQQDRVDGFEKALHDALDGLEPTAGVPNYAACGTVTATASSQQTKQEPGLAEYAVDCKPSTMWHTDWTKTTMPHWIDLKLNNEQLVNGLQYTPRNGGGNGTITKYEIQVSTNGTDYQKVHEGTWAQDGVVKTVSFAPVKATNVRLIAKEAKNKNGSAVEIKIQLAPTDPDIDGLTAAIKKAQGVSTDIFTTQSLAALNEKLAAAQKLVDAQNPDATEVSDAKIALIDAIAALELGQKADPVDPTEPIDPTDPVDPKDPTEPTDPADPVDPTEPVDPENPADPTDPVDPKDPADSAASVKKMPATGSHTVWAMLGSLALVATGMVLATRHRHA